MTGERLERLFVDGDEKDAGHDLWLAFDESLRRAVSQIAWSVGAGEDEARRQLDRACAEAFSDDDREKIRAAFERAFPKCESPIERILLPWLISQRYQCFNYAPKVLLPGEGDRLKDYEIALVPQLPIGRYRVDFALATKRGGPIRFIVVECDGAAFHNSVEQVKRDVDREVRIEMNERVLAVVRLDGREIVRSPAEAAQRVAMAVLKAWEKPRP